MWLDIWGLSEMGDTSTARVPRVPWVPWVPWAQPERQAVQLVKWHPCHQRPQPGDQVGPQQDQWDISCSPLEMHPNVGTIFHRSNQKRIYP